jgi:hypothetical protein
MVSCLRLRCLFDPTFRSELGSEVRQPFPFPWPELFFISSGGNPQKMGENNMFSYVIVADVTYVVVVVSFVLVLVYVVVENINSVKCLKNIIVAVFLVIKCILFRKLKVPRNYC